MTEFEKGLQLLGAGGFGAIIGWYVYYINRYRKDDVQFSDLTTVIGIIGGGVVLNLFDTHTALFGAYGVGLFAGFFSYLMVLTALVKNSPNFNADYFLDGRRKVLADDENIPGNVQQPVRAMSLNARVASLEAGMAERFAAPQGSQLSLPAMFDLAAAWTPTAAAQRLITACEGAWDITTRADCNKYAKAVLAEFNLNDFAAGANANQIAANLASPEWLSTNGWTGVANGAAAKAAADAGLLVVGAIEGGNYVPPAQHGHVVVVVSSENLHRGKYPFAFWGMLNGIGEQNQPVTHAYNADSVDKVVYASKIV